MFLAVTVIRVCGRINAVDVGGLGNRRDRNRDRVGETVAVQRASEGDRSDERKVGTKRGSCPNDEARASGRSSRPVAWGKDLP